MLVKRLFVIFFVISGLLNAQKKQQVLFTVDNTPVTTAEFLRVYNKNKDIVAKENKKTIEEYLELYINYKLKLKQAYELKLDTNRSYKRELEKYKQQLIQPYLKDANVTKALVKEAYDRMTKEINASHILVRLAPKAAPKDTLKAYNRIIEARTKVISGMPFDAVAKELSEDPSAEQNGGNLGYFSAFDMVYPFENAVFSSKKGAVSMPFRTSFGYHIVQVNDIRPSKGEVEVAHIMIKNDSANANYANSQIKDIHAKLQQGEAFERLAQKYSDDRTSAPKGGLLQKFSATKMIQPFSRISFALEKPNDVSQPFETYLGWHIVKLIKKHPIQPYEKLESELIKRIERSERAYAAGKSVADRLKTEYNIKTNAPIKAIFLSADVKKANEKSEEVLFTINGEKTYLKQLNVYNARQRNKSLVETFNDFLDQEIITYYKSNLEDTNTEFATILQEYKDGLLLFDLLQEKVWRKSEKDTVGLKKYYEKNKEKYIHDKRVDVVIATCTKKDKAILVKKYLEQGKDIETIKNEVNESPTIHVLFSKGIINTNNRKLPKGFEVKKGVSNIYNTGKNEFVIVRVAAILEPTFKKFKEAKGLVMNDYQEYLEKAWISNLRNNYKVKVNKKVLKKLVKQHQ